MDGLTPTIHTSTQEVRSYLGRSAIDCTISLAKNPDRATGKRVDVKFWLDTNELELRLITGTFADVVVIEREVVPNGTITDAQDFARFYLLGEGSK